MASVTGINGEDKTAPIWVSVMLADARMTERYAIVDSVRQLKKVATQKSQNSLRDCSDLYADETSPAIGPPRTMPLLPPATSGGPRGPKPETDVRRRATAVPPAGATGAQN